MEVFEIAIEESDEFNGQGGETRYLEVEVTERSRLPKVIYLYKGVGLSHQKITSVLV